MDITDASNFPGQADQLFTPETESEVADIQKRASQQKIPVTICGALTGLARRRIPLRRLGPLSNAIEKN